MSIRFRFRIAPTIKGASAEVLKQFVGLEVPINQLRLVGDLNLEKSVMKVRLPKYITEGSVVMLKQTLISSAFSQRKYELAHYLESSAVAVDAFTVALFLVEEVY